jgi:hypothetical protein
MRLALPILLILAAACGSGEPEATAKADSLTTPEERRMNRIEQGMNTATHAKSNVEAAQAAGQAQLDAEMKAAGDSSALP